MGFRCLVRDQEVEGPNPFAPTIISWSLPCNSDRAPSGYGCHSSPSELSKWHLNLTLRAKTKERISVRAPATCAWARGFFARFNRMELGAPPVEVLLGHPEVAGRLIDPFAGPHALCRQQLKLPGISLSFFHLWFVTRRLCRPRMRQFEQSSQFALLLLG
jgi:hypothetical protein